MITGFLISIFTAFVGFLIGLLPVIAFPTEFGDAVELVWGYVQAMSFLFPVATLLSVLSIAITFHLGVFGFKFTRWVIHLVRGN